MGTMDLFIGKRLHSCIFAISKRVPTLLLGYEKKAWGIMKMLDHEKYVLDINNIKAEKLMMDMQPGDVPATYADVDDLVRDLDYRPNTTLEYGVARFVEWYKEYYKI